MTAYSASPEDSRTIITPGASMGEVRDAESALAQMQRTVTASLKQRERLAQLGQAVAKISHDLRNVLSTSQILADRLEGSADPGVRRTAPKLVGSISRAVNLCETTLAFGKAEEPQPTMSIFNLAPLVADVVEAETLAAEAADLADKARNKKLSADAMQGACFTISSLGHIGGTGFTPIVNAPEVAILGVSKATMQPVWDGKAFQPRLMLPLSLSYDHRVINGAAAARFTKRLGELLADIRTLLL